MNILTRTGITLAAIGATAVLHAPTAGADAVPADYTRTDMIELLTDSVELIDRFYAERAAAGLPAAVPDEVLYVDFGVMGTGPCGPFDERVFGYCALDNSIYIGLAELWTQYSEYSPATAVVAVAHEYGHVLQVAAGNEVPLDASPERSDAIRAEDQADCVAGAWANWAHEENLIDAWEDIVPITASHYDIGQAESPEQDHGRPAERAASYLAGFTGGMGACELFFTDYPLT